jgi:hypothetical protein
MNRLPPAKFYLDYLHADAGVGVCIVRYGVGAYTVKHGVGACIVRHGVSKYSGRKITESLGNFTVRGGKGWKSKGRARLSTVCLSMYSISENIYYSQLSSIAILLQPEPKCFTLYNTRK